MTKPFLDAVHGKPLDQMSPNKLKSTVKSLSTQVHALTTVNEEQADAVKAVMEEAIESVETFGAMAIASGAEGYWGTEKLQVGGVDMRIVGGLSLAGFGLYQTLSPEKEGGTHALAIGKGLLGSFIASKAVDVGRTLKDARNKKATSQQAPAEQPVLAQIPVQAAPQPAIQGPLREIVLTPEPDPVPLPRMRVAGEPEVPSRSNRFVRAQMR